jgi:predicted nucleotidyltransferase
VRKAAPLPFAGNGCCFYLTAAMFDLEQAQRMTITLETLPREAVDHLAAFKREVEAALPGRVTRVTLFGSRARGDAEEDSDYDVAVFVQDLSDRSEVGSVVSDVAYPHILEGIHISPIVLPAEYADDTERTELAWEIAKDGVIL